MMKHVRVAALVAAGMGAAVPAMAASPIPYDTGNGILGGPVVVVQMCSTTTNANGATVGVPCAPGQAPGGTASSAAATVAGSATEQNVAVSTTAVTVGAAGTYRTEAFQPMGAPICATFGSGTLVAPTAGGVCAVGVYVAAGVTVTYSAAVPGTALRAISSGSATVWLQVQS